MAVVLLCSVGAPNVAAQQINKLVMPGKLVQSHADIEAQCDACHSATDTIAQSTLCMDCHEEVARDRTDNTGFHGRFDAASRNECVNCHTDHEGRDHDIVGLSSGLFDHSNSDFPLSGGHLNAACVDCHAEGERYLEAPNACVDCHQADDVHAGGLGTECQSCHVADSFAKIDFDHKQLGFSLNGKHGDVACLDCHRGNNFESAPRTCNGCHAVDDVHQGGKGTQCAQCHNEQSWSGINFDHFSETGFALAGGHNGLVCEACHTRSDYKDAQFECTSCHLSDDHHQGQFGMQCQDCHDVRTWSDTQFDHSATAFSLTGSHVELQCSSCHNQVDQVELGSDCGSCHAADDVHGGQLGVDCQGCHATSSWKHELSFDHDLSGFPLIGLHASAPCSGCHQSQRFTDAPQACVDCHREVDVHQGSLGDSCASCHNPTNWSVWTFDHALTDFPLTGLHAEVSCGSCHSGDDTSLAETSTDCVACHRADDPHEGQLGQRCETCHSSSGFMELNP